jgi:uncharacterized protein YggU (UPF0235/DUF167 family)
VRITVRVRPSAGRVQVGGSFNGALVVKVQQAAVDGKATAAVLVALAEAFEVGRDKVAIVSGSRARTKIVEVAGATDDRLTELLNG